MATKKEREEAVSRGQPKIAGLIKDLGKFGAGIGKSAFEMDQAANEAYTARQAAPNPQDNSESGGIFTAKNFPYISGAYNALTDGKGASGLPIFAPEDPASLPTVSEMFSGNANAQPRRAAPSAPAGQPLTPSAAPISPTGISSAGRQPSQPVQVPGGGSNAQAPFVPSEANNFGVTVARGLDIQRPGDPRQSAGDYALSEQGIRGAIDYSTRRAADANAAFASRLKKMASRLAGNKNITPAMAQAVLSSMATRFRPSAGTGLAAQGLASSASRYASDRGVSRVVASARAKRDLNPFDIRNVTDLSGASSLVRLQKGSGSPVPWTDEEKKNLPSNFLSSIGKSGDGDDGIDAEIVANFIYNNPGQNPVIMRMIEQRKAERDQGI